ncbi:MAG: hypothetical protein PUH07_08475 [Methanobrevibacter smithii]|nr:hypothetical protein [Methanobrevibacter smithii]MDD7245123.1 hypothetical protein [Methanobrevibacter smithii]
MINEIKSQEGYVFALKDKSAVYDNIIVLGIYDSAENYIQIPYFEAEELKKQKEKLLRGNVENE